MAVVPEQRLAITLRFLAGGLALDLLDMAPVALSSVYQIVWSTIAVINTCSSLAFNFDSSLSACRERAATFQARSGSPDAFSGCVGAIDGLFIRVTARSKSEVTNPRSFYNGHKHGFGVNLQVICDAYCRVIGASCNTPGLGKHFASLHVRRYH